MAKIMVMIDVPNISFKKLEKMMNTHQISDVGFIFYDGDNKVSIYKRLLKLSSSKIHPEDECFEFELIGVRP